MKKNKLVIVQPALGRYRRGFIRSLVYYNASEFNISIYCSPFDNLGVRSMASVDKSIHYNKASMISIFGLFFWQCFVYEIISLRMTKGDIFVFNGNPRFLSSIILAFYFKLRGVDVIWWGHGRSSTSSRLGSFIRFKLMSFFRVMLYTDSEVAALAPVVKSSMCGLNNGLDVESIREGFVQNYSKYDDEVLDLVFIGRLTAKSQFDLLIKAMLKLPHRVAEKYRLNVIGNSDYSKIIKQEPEALRLNIECHGEIWDEGKITQILSRCHIFIYPGSVGLSIVHAFACGLPAIVHDNGDLHMPEIGCFESGYNGESFKYGSSSALSSKLIEISKDRQALKVYSLNAYNTVTSTYNTKDMAVRFFNFIRK